MAVQGITETQANALNLPGIKGGTMRVAHRSGGTGDQVSLSKEALNVAEGDGIRANRVHATLGKDDIVFDNAKGTVTWGGTRLNLKPIGNTLKDDLIVEKVSSGYRVMNYTDNTQLFLDPSGQPIKNAFGKAAVTQGFVGPSTNGALFIGNQKWADSGTSYNDVLINRRADANIYAGAGDDKIFNLNSRVSSIDTVAGNDAVYSVGLRAGAHIDAASSESSYVKLLGAAQGATISLGGSTGVLDAKGKRVANSTITVGGNAEQSMGQSFVALGTLDGGSLTMKADQSSVDAKRITGAGVSFGTGANSLVADTIAGKAGDASGTSVRAAAGSSNTFNIGALNTATVDVAKSDDNAITLKRNSSNSTISLGAGGNSVDAGKRTLHNMVITSLDVEQPDPSDPNAPPAEEAGKTAIAAGKITATRENGSRIELAGNGNSVAVTGVVRNATISLGTGANTFSAGSVNKLNLTAGGENSEAEQNVSVRGNAVNFNYTGSGGKDNVSVGGSMSGGGLNLGEGDNSVSIAKAMTKTAVSAGENATTALSAASYSGTGNNDITLGNGGNSLTFRRQVLNAAMTLGGGANVFQAGSVGGKSGVSLSVDVDSTQAQSVRVNGTARKLAYQGGEGIDKIAITGNLIEGNLNVGGGNNALDVGQGNTGGQIRGSSIEASGTGSTTLRATSIRNGVNQYTRISLGDGGNTVGIGGTINGNTSIALGEGANTFISRSILGRSGATVEIEAGGVNSTMAQSLYVTGKANFLNYTGSSGTDSVVVSNGVKNSNMDLGYGEKYASFVGGPGMNLVYQEGPPPSPDDPNAGIGNMGDGMGGLDGGIPVGDMGIGMGGPVADLGDPVITPEGASSGPAPSSHTHVKESSNSVVG